MISATEVPEVLFDRYFAGNPSPIARARYVGRATSLALGDENFSRAVEATRDEINKVFAANVSSIVTPTGKARVHLDYVQSAELNAFAFFSNDWAFIAITTALLARLTEISLQLWRLNLLENLLGIPLDTEGRNNLAAAFVLVQIQILSSHELGHFFHGHCASELSTFVIAEFATNGGLATSSFAVDQFRIQAMEVEADGYAAHMMLENLFSGGIGLNLHSVLNSALTIDEFTLNFFLCALGSLFYLWGNRSFDSKTIRDLDHPPALMRLNVFMRDVRGWFSEHKPALETEASVSRFQEIMAAISEAAEGAIDQEPWRLQGEFLLCDEGRLYIDALYAKRETLRTEMKPNRWHKIP
jgi:hypothetical protein